MGVVELYTDTLRDADEALRREHEWLSARVDSIAELMAGRRFNPELLAEAQRRYRLWAEERTWFTRETGSITFEEVCQHVGADIDAARAARAKYYALPFSGALFRIRCENTQSKTNSSGKGAAGASG